jgi:hypothetical protein
VTFESFEVKKIVLPDPKKIPDKGFLVYQRYEPYFHKS